MPNYSQRSPLRVLLLTLILTIAGLCWVIWSIYSVNYRNVAAQNAWTLEVTDIRGEIILLDEILSSSARLAAETGKENWEHRYREHEIQLTTKIERAIELVPELLDVEKIATVDKANIALVTMEEQAFSYIREGQLTKAKQLLYSEKYEELKTIYTTGMSAFEHSLHTAIEQAENRRQINSQIQIWVVSVITIVLSIGWMVVFRLFGNWWNSIEQARIGAERANEAKTNFLSAMSHEIRTPLNGVIGVTQLLADTKLDSDQKSKVETIQSSGHTLLAIINDILDMSKVEAGAVELENTAFSLSDLLSTTMTTVQSLATDKGLDFKVSKSDACPNYLLGDPVRIRQILWNLMSNAIKFTEKGSITVTLTKEEIEDDRITQTKDIVLRLRVVDTGKGIDPERLKIIFDPFAQEDNTITRTHGGTGLGLSIVQNMVELMGGFLHLESAIGKGSCFDIYIPFEIATLEQQHSLHLENEDHAVIEGNDLDILVAEDNGVNAMIAKAFLEKFGHDVRIAVNGKLAVEQVQISPPDMIFMDIHMPEMDGLEATENIRRLKIGANIPIIGLTAEAFTERHIQFINKGMDDVMSKPFTEAQLYSTISKYRKGRQKQAS